MLLLLVWRHLGFYLEGRHINNPDLKGPIAQALRLASAPGPDVLRGDAERRLAPVLASLRALDIVRRPSFAPEQITDRAARDAERGDGGLRVELVRQLPGDHDPAHRGRGRDRGRRRRRGGDADTKRAAAGVLRPAAPILPSCGWPEQAMSWMLCTYVLICFRVLFVTTCDDV